MDAERQTGAVSAVRLAILDAWCHVLAAVYRLGFTGVYPAYVRAVRRANDLYWDRREDSDGR